MTTLLTVAHTHTYQLAQLNAALACADFSFNAIQPSIHPSTHPCCSSQLNQRNLSSLFSPTSHSHPAVLSLRAVCRLSTSRTAPHVHPPTGSTRRTRVSDEEQCGSKNPLPRPTFISLAAAGHSRHSSQGRKNSRLNRRQPTAADSKQPTERQRRLKQFAAARLDATQPLPHPLLHNAQIAAQSRNTAASY